MASGGGFFLLDFGASHRDGGTPLHSAAFGGHADVIVALLKAKAGIDSEDMLVLPSSRSSCSANVHAIHSIILSHLVVWTELRCTWLIAH